MIRKLERAIARPRFRIFIRPALVSLFIAASITVMVHNAAALPSLVIREPDEVVLTLTAEGFTPAEVTRTTGRFQLSVDNRSGVEELTLHLKRSDGTQLREMRVAGGGGDWSEVFDLTQGSYTLSEANHSNWVCQIIIN